MHNYGAYLHELRHMTEKLEAVIASVSSAAKAAGHEIMFNNWYDNGLYQGYILTKEGVVLSLAGTQPAEWYTENPSGCQIRHPDLVSSQEDYDLFVRWRNS